MKKYILISMIVVGSFASSHIASAGSVATIDYADWAVSAFNISGDN